MDPETIVRAVQRIDLTQRLEDPERTIHLPFFLQGLRMTAGYFAYAGLEIEHNPCIQRFTSGGGLSQSFQEFVRKVALDLTTVPDMS
jgi:hypothetical protein